MPCKFWAVAFRLIRAKHGMAHSWLHQKIMWQKRWQPKTATRAFYRRRKDAMKLLPIGTKPTKLNWFPRSPASSVPSYKAKKWLLVLKAQEETTGMVGKKNQNRPDGEGRQKPLNSKLNQTKQHQLWCLLHWRDTQVQSIVRTVTVRSFSPNIAKHCNLLLSRWYSIVIKLWLLLQSKQPLVVMPHLHTGESTPSLQQKECLINTSGR